MDIINTVDQYVTTETCWVMTQAGYDMLVRKRVSPVNLATRQPGMPVPDQYRQSCPIWWVYNGWVAEADGQLSLW